MLRWHEFQLWYFKTAIPEDLFDFKKKYLLPLYDRPGVKGFLTLDEPDFSLARVLVEDDTAQELKTYLETAIAGGNLFSRVTAAAWDPKRDAVERIVGARARAGIDDEIPPGGWQITGMSDGKWVACTQDLEKQAESFSIFMSRVLGSFTRAYIQEMPHPVKDRWLMSVFLHLMMNSISIYNDEEDEVRRFPAV